MNFKELATELQSLDIQDPGRWSAPIRFGAALLIFLLIAIGSTAYFYKNKTPEIEQFESKEVELRQKFEVKQKKAVNLDAYKKQLEKMEGTFKGMLNQLPSKTELDKLVDDISQAALTSGLEEKEFKKLNENVKEFYAEQSIDILLEGSYHQFADFVSKVAALPRIVTLHDFNISSITQNVKTNRRSKAEEFLQMRITAKTYRYLDDDELEAAQ